ncbi:MAG: hypothetical protein IPK13_03025 [Deltaproteobacteria bacterium]|nr:hypothetical protein [Deltaproteobacteria bacterium]
MTRSRHALRILPLGKKVARKPHSHRPWVGFRRDLLLSLTLPLALSCQGPPESELVTHDQAALAGVAGDTDQADTRCQVVLRSMQRIPDETGGYRTQAGSWIWRAEIDVSDAAVSEGLTPLVYYQNAADQVFRTQSATKVASVGGYTRFTADVFDGMPSSGMSGTALRNTVVRVIPYLSLAQGGRLFDHNRVHEPLGMYQFTGETGLAILDDDAVCPPRSTAAEGTLRFLARSVEQEGALRAGGALTIEYDLGRLQTCRGTHNGFPAWDIIAHVRFLPGEQEDQGSVRAFGSMGGNPANSAFAIPFVTQIPADATRVEVWFENYTGAGSSCRAWDSNYGKNFGFSVQAPVGWIGKPVVAITRSGATECSGSAMNEGFTYDTWVRQRASYRNVCFEVWQKNVTDRNNPDLWREISVEFWYRYAEDEPFERAFVPFDGRSGNNARYAFNLSGVDPFRPYRCTTEPYVTTPEGSDLATMEFYITANGVPLRQADGSNFVGRFVDDPGAHNCP